MGRKIGVKLADGRFYGIMDDDAPGRKALVLTTVSDSQPSVQIDLYRGDGAALAGAEYVGSLIVERIPPAPGGTPDIRLELELDPEGALSAVASDVATGESRSLSVSIASLDAEAVDATPDFAVSGDDSVDVLEESEVDAALVDAPELGGDVLSLSVPDLDGVSPADVDTLEVEGPGGELPDIDTLDLGSAEDFAFADGPEDGDSGGFGAGDLVVEEGAVDGEAAFDSPDSFEIELPDFSGASSVEEDAGSGGASSFEAEPSELGFSVPEDESPPDGAFPEDDGSSVSEDLVAADELLPDFSVDTPEPELDADGEAESFTVPEFGDEEETPVVEDALAPLPREDFDERLRLKAEDFAEEGLDAGDGGLTDRRGSGTDRKRSSLWAIVALALAALLVAAFMVQRCTSGQGLPPLPSALSSSEGTVDSGSVGAESATGGPSISVESGATDSTAPAATTSAPAATTSAPAATTSAPAATTSAPAATTSAPAATTEATVSSASTAAASGGSAKVADKGSIVHKVRWGDTLWDISIYYYRTPWYYGWIARYNGIKNPDRIVAGTIIYVPKL